MNSTRTVVPVMVAAVAFAVVLGGTAPSTPPTVSGEQPTPYSAMHSAITPSGVDQEASLPPPSF